MTDFSPQELPATPDVAGGEWDAVDPREALTFDAETETYRASFDGDAESMPLAIVLVVSAVSNTPPVELPPLYDSVDADGVVAVQPPEASTA